MATAARDAIDSLTPAAIETGADVEHGQVEAELRDVRGAVVHDGRLDRRQRRILDDRKRRVDVAGPGVDRDRLDAVLAAVCLEVGEQHAEVGGFGPRADIGQNGDHSLRRRGPGPRAVEPLAALGPDGAVEEHQRGPATPGRAGWLEDVHRQARRPRPAVLDVGRDRDAGRWRRERHVRLLPGGRTGRGGKQQK